MTFSADIHGVSLSIESPSAEVIAFARQYFHGFPEATTPTRIRCSIRFASGYSFRLQEKKGTTGHTLGSGLAWDAETNTLSVFEREWSYTVSEKDSLLVGEITFKKNIWKHAIHVLTLGKRETHRRYYRAAIRLLPQTLLFQKLEERGIQIHSGAAVAINGTAFIFAGLPGSGKSTLAHALRKNCGAEILTENFVLTDGTKLYPFPEGNVLSKLAPIPIKNVYALSHGDVFSVTEISSERMIELTKMIDTLTAELPVHAKIAAQRLVDDKNSPKDLPYSAPAHTLVADKSLSETVKYFSSL